MGFKVSECLHMVWRAKEKGAALLIVDFSTRWTAVIVVIMMLLEICSIAGDWGVAGEL